MKTAIILHGMPSKEEYFKPDGSQMSQKHWQGWLQHQLLLNGVVAQTPELPEPYEPDYEKWKEVFERFRLDKETILVGHSCGGGFLVRWLSENKVEVGKVALVAPWINPHDTRPKPGFFDFKIDPQLANKTKAICLFISSDDHPEELDSANKLNEGIKNLQTKEFFDKGHFTFSDMKTKEFPELRDWLLQ